MIQFTRAKPYPANPRIMEIVGRGGCPEEDVLEMGLPGEVVIPDTFHDADLVYLLDGKPVPKDRLCPETVSLAAGELWRIDVPVGTRITIRRVDTDTYIGSDLAHDGVVEFQSDFSGTYQLFAILPPGSAKQLPRQTVTIEVGL